MRRVEAGEGATDPGLKERCAALFGRAADDVRLIHAPYRLCPLGAHIDHQHGAVSAIAVNQGIDLAFVANDDEQIEIVSEGYPGTARIPLRETPVRGFDWADYARGALFALSQRRRLHCGVSILVSGALSEAGISSSAAVGLGYLLAIATANSLRLSDADLIEMDRIIENDFLGLKNGILDQSAITLARPGELAIIDCRMQTASHVAQPRRFDFLTVCSGLKEALVSSGRFNDRVEECLQAGAELARLARGVDAPLCPLGELSRDEWLEHGSSLPPPLRRRAEHFFTESARVRAGARAWAESDAAEFGELMQQSGLSSINNYETGSPEMIRLFEVLNECKGVAGARFSGAGFRGCAVALIDPERTEDILDEVETRFLRDFPSLREAMWAFTSDARAGLTLR